MEMTVTFLVQGTIEAKSEEDYAKKLAKMTRKLEKMGFYVNLENESEDDCEECDDE